MQRTRNPTLKTGPRRVGLPPVLHVATEPSVFVARVLHLCCTCVARVCVARTCTRVGCVVSCGVCAAVTGVSSQQSQCDVFVVSHVTCAWRGQKYKKKLRNVPGLARARCVMAARAAHAACHCEAARPKCLSERRRRPPFHPPTFTLRAACGLVMLVGTQARSSAASPKSATVSCKAANPQDSAIEQCSSWCKADQEHAQHCTVRHEPQPCVGSTLPALCIACCMHLYSGSSIFCMCLIRQYSL